MNLKQTLAASLMLTSGILACQAGAEVETRAYYSTNPSGAVGKTATISIDGEFNDWSESMIIATCGANDVANAFKGSHENCVLDVYALYAAWDDQNLYMAWQMCNTGDTWAREGDGPLTDYGKIGDVPFILALSVDPSKPGMTGLLQDGRCIWCDSKGNGTTFDPAKVHVDHMLFMSGKPGQGSPAMFMAVDAQGNSNYNEGKGFINFANAGISYKLKDGFQPSHLWRQKMTAQWATPTELVSDPSVLNSIYDPECYDNLLAGPVQGLKPHDTKFDTFYEIKIPLKALGISRQWLEANGIGARIIATRGESALDCCPHDPSMVDNTFGEYGKDNSTTHEKDDMDVITYAMADVAKIRDLSNIEPTPGPTPGPDPDPTPGPEPVEGSYNVFFDCSEWTSPHVYIWDKGSNDAQLAGAWPGTAITAKYDHNGRTLWHYAFTPAETPVKPMIIFNNSGNPQTADLEYVNNGIYTRDGFTGEKVNIVSEVAEVEVENCEALYFNLQGQPLQEAPQKGIFIIVKNGKAVKTCK